MPLLDSFTVDHTIMRAPAVRVAKTMKTPKGDVISVYDLRFTVPNKEILSSEGIHTLEHLFAGYMRKHSAYEVIDISPMGCRTGFYMSLIGEANEEEIAVAWIASMEDILKTEHIPEANVYQCGSCFMHSLKGAKEIADMILQRGVSITDNTSLAFENIDTVDNRCDVSKESVAVIG